MEQPGPTQSVPYQPESTTFLRALASRSQRHGSSTPPLFLVERWVLPREQRHGPPSSCSSQVPPGFAHNWQQHSETSWSQCGKVQSLNNKQKQKRFHHQRHLSHQAGSGWCMQNCVVMARGLFRLHELWRGGFKFPQREVRLDTGTFHDSYLFRALNACGKGPPWYSAGHTLQLQVQEMARGMDKPCPHN